MKIILLNEFYWRFGANVEMAQRDVENPVKRLIEYGSNCRKLVRVCFISSDIGIQAVFGCIVAVVGIDALEKGLVCDVMSTPILLMIWIFGSIWNIVLTLVYVFNVREMRDNDTFIVLSLTISIVYAAAYFVFGLVFLLAENMCFQVGDRLWTVLLCSIVMIVLIPVKLFVFGYEYN